MRDAVRILERLSDTKNYPDESLAAYEEFPAGGKIYYFTPGGSSTGRTPERKRWGLLLRLPRRRGLELPDQRCLTKPCCSTARAGVLFSRGCVFCFLLKVTTGFYPSIARLSGSFRRLTHQLLRAGPGPKR